MEKSGGEETAWRRNRHRASRWAAAPRHRAGSPRCRPTQLHRREALLAAVAEMHRPSQPPPQRRSAPGAVAGSLCASPGLAQGLHFRRNSGENFVSASYREVKFRYFSLNFVSKFKNSKKIVKKYDKKLGAFLSE